MGLRARINPVQGCEVDTAFNLKVLDVWRGTRLFVSYSHYVLLFVTLKPVLPINLAQAYDNY